MKQLNTFVKCWFGTFIIQNPKSLIGTHSPLIQHLKSIICILCILFASRCISSKIYNLKSIICIPCILFASRCISSKIYNLKSIICILCILFASRCISSKIYNLKSIICILCILGVSSVSAQQYPVQGTLAVMAPYPAYLSDYANASIEKLVLNLTLTDLNLSHKQVKLRLFIQSQNTIIAQSNTEVVNERTLVLDGGVPQQFTSTELAVYFNLENLQGITQAAYSQPLPEGVYTFGFEVFDYFTGHKLSGRIQQLFWLTLSDPPLLNMPLNNENIRDADPNNPQIVFQWTPRDTQVGQTEYTFTLSELWDEEGNSSQQFLAAIPKYETTTPATTLIYGLSEPPLLTGRTYAWRVQAKAKAGFENVGLYRQEGYSAIFTFKYGGQCPMVENVQMEVKSYDRIYISWEPPLTNTSLHTPLSYTVAARKYTSNNNWQWVEFQTTNTYYNLVNIEASTEYEIKVGNNCSSGTTTLISYTLPQRVTTLAKGQVAGIVCGQVPVIDLSNQTLIEHLSVNDVVMAADFSVVLLSVSGDKNGWSGEAWTKVKWLGGTKIKLKYKGIKVNTDKRLIGDGYFETTYEPRGKNIGDVDKTIDSLTWSIKNLVDSFKKSGTPFTIDTTRLPPRVHVNEEIKEVTKKTNGQTVIRMANGKEIALPKGTDDFIVTDKNGKEVAYDKKNDEIAIKSESSKKRKVYFKVDGDETKYADGDYYISMIKDEFITVTAFSEAEEKLSEALKWMIEKDVVQQGKDKSLKINLNKKAGTYSIKLYEGEKQVAMIKLYLYETPVVKFASPDDYDGQFGFDDGFEKHENLRPDYEKLPGIKDYYVPLITLLPGQSVSLKLKITISDKAKRDKNLKILLKDEKENLTIDGPLPFVINSANINLTKTISINAKDNTETPLTELFQLFAYNSKNKKIGALQYYCKPTKTIKIRFIYVNHGSGFPTSPSANDIIDYLNTKSMNQLFLKFELDGADTTKTRMNFKKTYQKMTVTTSKQAGSVLNALKSDYAKDRDILIKTNNDLEYFFITDISLADEEKGTQTGGIHGIGTNHGALFKFSEERKAAIAHELGHKVYLHHTFCEKNSNAECVSASRLLWRFILKSGTKNNFMDYSVPRKTWFKYQIQNKRTDFTTN